MKYALYIDESGLPNSISIPMKSSQTPTFVLAGIALPINSWKDYTQDLVRLKRSFFDEQIKNLGVEAYEYEIKGADLVRPGNAKNELRQKFLKAVIRLVKKYNGVSFTYCLRKEPNKVYISAKEYIAGLTHIISFYEKHLDYVQGEGIVIIDSRMAHITPNKGTDYGAAKSLLGYYFGNTHGKTLKNILEAPMFADSLLTAGLQLADIFAALIRADLERQHYTPDELSGYRNYNHVEQYHLDLKNICAKFEKKKGGVSMCLCVRGHGKQKPTKTQLEKLTQKFNSG
ncbi:MAG: DUF3800 domain-containing protein [Alphaproteobacteria bacterium]